MNVVSLVFLILMAEAEGSSVGEAALKKAFPEKCPKWKIF